MPGSDPNVRRSFGYVRIRWKVKHFWLWNCIQNWEVGSPAFDVQKTRWRLLLRSMSTDVSRRHLCAYLQRLTTDDGPDVVRVHWLVRMRNSTRGDNCCCQLLKEKKQMFGRGDYHPEEVIEDMESLSRYFKPFKADNLVIECKLVVDDPKTSSKKWWSETEDKGLKSLSDDLGDLFRKRNFSDILINIRGVEVPAVKAILYARNKTLAEIMDRDISATVIELPGVDQCPADFKCYTVTEVNADAVSQLLGYLHHGRLDEIVFGQPSVSVAECSSILNVCEVSAHYIPDELTLTSELDVEDHVVTWIVREFEEWNICPIASPTLIHNSSEEGGPAWRLVLYPRGKEGTGNHVAIYPEASGEGEEGRSKLACMEFALADGEQNFRCYRRLLKPPGKTFEGLGVDNFLDRPLKWVCGTLQVVFRLRISDGAARLFKAHRQVMSVGAFLGGGLQHLQLLSEEMKRLLLEDTVLRDFTIRCSGGYSFRVHRCIMAARAYSFSALAGKSDELDLGHMNVTEDAVSALVWYIYSGQLEADEEQLADELLILAEYLGVDALARTYSRILDRGKFVPRMSPSPQQE